ncbi:uncharacterized protein LOC124196138 [Daphnia pulex]|uniref:uncharacterized protein LOC124196138 n=1 Tax=Daphnia pulex TaxID=6669 RepID=UPI001EDD743B|nr:uncharacterized protein LOC124196138 [Daphnia pulex]
MRILSAPLRTKMRFLMLLLLNSLMVTNSFEIITRTPSPLLNRNSDQLNGANLKYVFFQVPPFVVMSSGPDGNYTVTGSNSKIIDWLAQKLNFTVSYVLIPNEMTKSKYGNKSDIAVTLNLIAEREVDGSPVGFIPTPERAIKMDFAYFLTAEPHAMVVPRPGEEPRLFAFIRPFQSSVWLLIFIASILVIASMCLFSKAYSKLLMNEREVSDTTALEWAGRYSMYIVNILTNQGIHLTNF